MRPVDRIFRRTIPMAAAVTALVLLSAPEHSLADDMFLSKAARAAALTGLNQPGSLPYVQGGLDQRKGQILEDAGSSSEDDGSSSGGASKDDATAETETQTESDRSESLDGEGATDSPENAPFVTAADGPNASRTHMKSCSSPLFGGIGFLAHGLDLLDNFWEIEAQVLNGEPTNRYSVATAVGFEGACPVAAGYQLIPANSQGSFSSSTARLARSFRTKFYAQNTVPIRQRFSPFGNGLGAVPAGFSHPALSFPTQGTNPTIPGGSYYTIGTMPLGILDTGEITGTEVWVENLATLRQEAFLYSPHLNAFPILRDLLPNSNTSCSYRSTAYGGRMSLTANMLELWGFGNAGTSGGANNYSFCTGGDFRSAVWNPTVSNQAIAGFTYPSPLQNAFHEIVGTDSTGGFTLVNTYVDSESDVIESAWLVRGPLSSPSSIHQLSGVATGARTQGERIVRRDANTIYVYGTSAVAPPGSGPLQQATKGVRWTWTPSGISLTNYGATFPSQQECTTGGGMPTGFNHCPAIQIADGAASGRAVGTAYLPIDAAPGVHSCQFMPISLPGQVNPSYQRFEYPVAGAGTRDRTAIITVNNAPRDLKGFLIEQYNAARATAAVSALLPWKLCMATGIVERSHGYAISGVGVNPSGQTEGFVAYIPNPLFDF